MEQLSDLIKWIAILEKTLPRAWSCLFFHENGKPGRSNIGVGDPNNHPYSLWSYWDTFIRVAYRG